MFIRTHKTLSCCHQVISFAIDSDLYLFHFSSKIGIGLRSAKRRVEDFVARSASDFNSCLDKIMYVDNN